MFYRYPTVTIAAIALLRAQGNPFSGELGPDWESFRHYQNVSIALWLMTAKLGAEQ